MWRMGWWNVLIRSVRLIIGVFYSSRVRDARRALVTGVQTCALPICTCLGHFRLASVLNARTAFRSGMTPRQQGYGTAAPSVTPNATVPHGAARRGPTRPLHHPHRHGSNVAARDHAAAAFSDCSVVPNVEVAMTTDPSQRTSMDKG